MHDRDIGGYVADAQRALAQKIRIPPGYRLEWSGQFEYLERAKAKLAIVVPITLVIIFVPTWPFSIACRAGWLMKQGSLYWRSIPHPRVGA
jgi:Cu/Ag efflux pump CusA